MQITPNYYLLVSCVMVISCSPGKQLAQRVDISLLQELMTGSFSSTRQASTDSAYLDITLHMYPVWQSDEGRWLYVEQAVTTMQDKPYRQRIYRLSHLDGNRYASSVYRLQDEARFVRKWSDPHFFDQFGQEILEEREGCTVFLSKKARNVFEGQTNGDACKSTLRGATYATSKVVISPDGIKSWDQGFDAHGIQVWGAAAGGYIFDRIN